MMSFAIGFIWGFSIVTWFMVKDEDFYKNPMMYFILLYPPLFFGLE